jgi:EAL domain-containing protein (putative c-di-GMP-specific phosphodiesterase class I)
LKPRGFEAFVRWKHPVHGEIAPSTFVPVAERVGLIAPFGEWILRKVLSEAVAWPDQLRVSVNLSPIQFGQIELPVMLTRIIRETGIDPKRIDLEITEGAVIADIARARRVFAVLQEIGVGIVLDDFGSGFSSIETLRALPFDKIKIDRAIMQKVGEEPIADAVLSAFLRLGHTLNLPVTVEGVETEAQLAVLRREPCDELQGYLVGRPAPWAHYAPLIAAGASGRKTA